MKPKARHLPPPPHITRALGPEEEAYKNTWSRENGRCESTLGAWGKPDARRCKRKGEGVFRLSNDRFIILCRECRVVRGHEHTPAERAARTKAFKASQVPLLDAIDLRPQDRGAPWPRS